MPKACSYWARFWPSRFHRALACCGLRKMACVVADGDLIGGIAGGQAEDQLEVPDADADMDAVGVGLAVVGGLDEVHLRLLCGWTHGFSRLLRLGRMARRPGLAGQDRANWS